MESSNAPKKLGIIFDLDGTLVDTLEDIRLSVNDAMAIVGQPALSVQQVRPLIGDGVANMLRRAAGMLSESQWDDIQRTYRAAYQKRMLDNTRCYPGVPEMLGAITESGIPMSILSNKVHEYTVAIVKALLSSWPFVAVQGIVDDQSRKPNPRHALTLAEAMRLAPADVVVIGDSASDVLTAKNAGMRSIAVTWGYRDRDVLLWANPDAMVDSPAALTAAILAFRK